MANLDGLSEEEARRNKALADKAKQDFSKAHAGAQPRTPDVQKANRQRANSSVNHVLTPNGQTRIEKTAQGEQREQAARDQADKWRARAQKSADKDQKRVNIRKEFNQARSRDKVNERSDLEL